MNVGDTVFVKSTDVYGAGDDPFYPAIVTRVFTEEDGEWAKDGEILGVTIFPHNGQPKSLDVSKAVVNDDDTVTDGWSDSPDGPGSTASTYDGAEANPAADPEATSGASTDTTPGVSPTSITFPQQNS